MFTNEPNFTEMIECRFSDCCHLRSHTQRVIKPNICKLRPPGSALWPWRSIDLKGRFHRGHVFGESKSGGDLLPKSKTSVIFCFMVRDFANLQTVVVDIRISKKSTVREMCFV